MLHRVLWILSLAGVASVHGTAGIQPAARSVEIDAVVTDGRGQFVPGLGKTEFRIVEDGRPLPIDSLTEVTPVDQDGPLRRRVILMLDLSGVAPQATPVVQQIARRFVASMNSADTIGVVRTDRRVDEPVGDQGLARLRIAEYRGGMVPFSGLETYENVLMKVARLSRELEDVPHRRKAIVCIGSPRVCDIREPRERRSSLLWPRWVDAVTAASRANVSVYAIDPEGVTGRVKLGGSNGLVAQTGGDVLYNSRAFDRAVDHIWREIGHYYLLRYTPAASSRELHSVDVDVARSGVRVRARQARG